MQRGRMRCAVRAARGRQAVDGLRSRRYWGRVVKHSETHRESGGDLLFPETDESRLERQRVAAGALPPRYAESWGAPFVRGLEPALAAGARVLDIGSGRRPTIPPELRPPGCEYVGLDASAKELEAAPPGSYDRVVVADVATPVAELVDQFDLILSWQVLEHVTPLEAVLANLRSYLRPGGRLVSQLSGRYAAFALLGRVIPYRLSVLAMTRLLDVEPETKFPTRYDRCYHDALEKLMSDWSSHEIIPRYKGGGYFRFSRPLEQLYLAYENWLHRHNRANLATHYVVVAVR
jgi:SAM-dependent methyltransferase